MQTRRLLIIAIALVAVAPRLAAQVRYLSPRWSPDGGRLLLVANLENPRRLDLFAINSDGSGLVKVREDARDGAWSPDGSRIVYAAMSAGQLDVYVMNADGSNARQLTATPDMDYQPLWSPDGRRIVFMSIPTGAGKRHDIHIMDADGSNRKTLTQTPSEELGLSWSPDSKHIAFGSNRDGNWEVYTMEATGGEARRLTNDPGADTGPAYSPDGRTVAFTSDRGGARRIWRVGSDGTDAAVLVSQAGASVAWSPDGRSVAYLGQADGASGVFVARTDGTAPRRVSPMPVVANRLRRLAWLAGCWERRTGEQVTREMWMAPDGELMLGASRTVAGGLTREFEQLRLEARGDTLVYTALPSGQRETAFRSTQVSDSAFMVENLTHDFPQRISYKRRGTDSVVARIEGPGPNGNRGIDFPMRRVSCVP